MGTRGASGKIKLSLEGSITNLLTDGQTATAPFNKQRDVTLEDGVDATQIDRIWQDEGRELSSGNSSTLTLSDFSGEDIGAGDGNDGLGQTIVFEEVVALFIYNAGPGDLALQSSASNPVTWLPAFTGDAALSPGSDMLLRNTNEIAFPVTATTADEIKFTAVGDDVVYDVVIYGRHDINASSSSSSPSSSSQSSSSSSSSDSSSLSSSSSQSSSSSSSP